MNYASQIVKPAEWQGPIPLELLMKGTMYKKDLSDKAASAITSQLDTLYNLPTLPGADTEVKNQAIKKLQESVSGIAMNDLSNSNVQAQIRQNINGVVSNPDFQTVISRGADYHQKMKKYAELTQDGETVSPWNMLPLKKYQDYINKGVYIKNTDFSGDIYKNSNYNKLFDEAAKEVAATTKFDINKGGYTVEEETKGQANIAAAIKRRVQNDPTAAQEFNRRFEFEHQNTNFDQVDAIQNTQMASLAGQQANKALLLGQQAAQKGDALGSKKYYDLWNQLKNASDQYHKMSQSPDGVMGKQHALEDKINEWSSENAKTYMFSKTKSVKANEFAVLSQQLNNQIYAHQQNEIADQIIPGALNNGDDPSLLIKNLHTPDGLEAAQKAAQSTQEIKHNKGLTAIESMTNKVEQAAYKQAIKNNVKVVDANGNLIPLENLPDFPSKPSKADASIKNSLEKYTKGYFNDGVEKEVLNLIKSNYEKLGFVAPPDDGDITLENGKIKVHGHTEKGLVYDTRGDKTFSVDDIMNVIGDTPNNGSSSSNKPAAY